MGNVKIKKVEDNEDKKITYAILNKNLKLSYEKMNFHEVINLSYAMIEDRLLTILDLLYIIDRNIYPYYPTDEIDKILRPVLKYNLDADKNKIYKINNISTKLKIIEKILKTKTDHIYFVDCKKSVENNIGIKKMLELIKGIKEWNKIRNEIIHSSFNKNISDLSEKTKECALVGYNLSMTIKNYTNKLKTNYENISVREKYKLYNYMVYCFLDWDESYWTLKKEYLEKNDLVIDFFQRTEGYIDSKFRNTFSILLKNKYFVMEYIFNKIYEKNIAEHLQKIPMNVINRKDLWIMLFTIALENIENNEWKNPGSSWIWKYFSEIINSFLTMINYSEEFISTSSIIKLFKCNNIKISDVLKYQIDNPTKIKKFYYDFMDDIGFSEDELENNVVIEICNNDVLPF